MNIPRHGKRPQIKEVARYQGNGPYGSSFGDYEGDFEPNQRPERKANNFRASSDYGDDFGPFKDDRKFLTN